MIQLALDFIDKKVALKTAESCLRYVDIIEAGTPLIKAGGISVVKDLKKLGLPVSADLKTFDAGRLEAELAAEYGADYATVLAAATNTTVKQFVSVCRSRGMKAVADLMNSPLKRVLFLEQAGVDFITVHSGIDEQRNGMTPFPTLNRVRRMVKTPLVVAGGIKAIDLAKIVPYANIIVIGSAITKSKDPVTSAKEIRRIYRKVKI